jgi:hypothetical protein
MTVARIAVRHLGDLAVPAIGFGAMVLASSGTPSRSPTPSVSWR